MGLKENSRNVRSSVAYAVSAIAQWDWPEQWPELFQILVEALTSGDATAVHGAMRVLTGQPIECTCTYLLNNHTLQLVRQLSLRLDQVNYTCITTLLSDLSFRVLP